MRRGRGAGQWKGNHLHRRLDPRFRGLREIVPQHGQRNYRYYFIPQCCYCCSVIRSCLTLHDPMDCSTRGFPVPHHLLEFAQFVSIAPVMSSNHLILCHPLILSSESAVHIKWPTYVYTYMRIKQMNNYIHTIRK